MTDNSYVATFAWALDVMKKGVKVRRRAWDKDGFCNPEYIALLNANELSQITGDDVHYHENGKELCHLYSDCAVILDAMETEDILATDWEFYEEEKK